MKREDIIRMRREADKFADEVCFGEIERTCENMELVSDERFAKLVQWYTLGQSLAGLIDFHVAEEREVCARQLDSSADRIRARFGPLTNDDYLCIGVLSVESQRIRARGEA
jgi:hypothetical protein